MSIFTHEYVLALYGVVLWQVEQVITSKINVKTNYPVLVQNLMRSMLWVGLIVVFDDELLAKYNYWAAQDYSVVPPAMYFFAGFFIDLARTYFTKKYIPLKS